MSNPLLPLADKPAFDQVQPAHVAPALDELLLQADAALEAVSADDFPADWLALSRGLDCATERLGRAWGVVSHLNSVADTSELRAAFNAALPRVTEFWTRLGAHAPTCLRLEPARGRRPRHLAARRPIHRRGHSRDRKSVV